MLEVPSALFSLMPPVFCALLALVPYMACSLHTLVPYVPRALVPHILHALRAHVPHLPYVSHVLRTLVSHGLHIFSRALMLHLYFALSFFVLLVPCDVRAPLLLIPQLLQVFQA